MFALLADSAEVAGYEAGRRLAWEPARVAASPEEEEAIGDPARYRWGYEFPSDGPGATLVTETSTAAVPRRAYARPSGTARGRDAMTASLARLELLAKAAGQRNQ